MISRHRAPVVRHRRGGPPVHRPGWFIVLAVCAAAGLTAVTVVSAWLSLMTLIAPR